jgi:phenylacetate-CoA ligase
MNTNTALSNVRRKVFNSYNQLPYPLKISFSNIARLLPSKFKFGKDYCDTLKLIRQTEYLPIEDLEALRLKQLRDILVHSFKTVEYYKRTMRKMSVTLNDIEHNPALVLSQMPFIDKNTILKESELFLSSENSKIVHDYTSTGGTSGEPFYFYFNSNRSAKEWAYFVDQWDRVGFDLKSKRATFRGSKINGLWEDDWITRERKFSSFELTHDYFYSIWASLHRYKPEFIYAYPSTAITLCQFMEEEQMQLPNCIKAILIGSENIYEGQREYIEAVSQTKVFIWYGHSEKLVLAGECEQSSYYHAYPQYGYVEFINDSGYPAKPGEFSEIVGTGFLNTVMPFIRYRTGDYCIYQGDRCPICGRNYHIFSDIKGRWTQEVLYGKKGNAISMSAINIHSKNMHKVSKFQFYQKEMGKASLKVVPKEGFGEKDKDSLEKEFNDKFNGSVVVHVETVSEIPLTQRGKYNYISQQVKLV